MSRDTYFVAYFVSAHIWLGVAFLAEPLWKAGIAWAIGGAFLAYALLWTERGQA